MHRILHLTDTHLPAVAGGVVSGWHTQASLDAVLVHAAHNGQHYDAILATGDLVHDGSAAGYRRLAQQLRAFGMPICVLPGNHDDPRHMRKAMHGGGVHVLTTLHLGAWNIIPLNSHRSGRVDGELGGEQLDWLHGDLAEREEFVLLAVHHPPVDVGCEWMDRVGLMDADALLRVCADYPHVRGIVSGHVHQAFETVRDGLALYTTPSTCRQFRPGCPTFAEDTAAPGYRTIILAPEGHVETLVHRVPAAARGQRKNP